MVALVNTDVLPAILIEMDLHKYLVSTAIGLLADEIAVLNDNAVYKQAVARVFRQQKLRSWVRQAGSGDLQEPTEGFGCLQCSRIGMKMLSVSLFLRIRPLLHPPEHVRLQAHSLSP